jgi:cobyrinic acid a,c-diamide synthase
VLRDKAFTFYYPENLEALEDEGAELVYIDAFLAKSLPKVHALYIGGGFPEIFMEELSANSQLRGDVRRAAEDGLPIYAECGGMMYLSKRIRWGERSAEMAGVLSCEIEVMQKPQGHGYVFAQVDTENPFFPVGTELRGHEFHNSKITSLEATRSAYQLRRGTGVGDQRDGLSYKNVLASYMHLHAFGNEGWARGLVACAARPAGARK